MTDADSPQPSKKRRLGQRTRLALDPIKEEAASQSELADFLVEQWAWGHLSPQLVQQIASKACSDMNKHPPKPLQDLAKLGGGWSSNMSKALIALQKPKLCQPYSIHLPYKSGQKIQSVLLPHELFASIYSNYKDTFESVLVGSPGHLEEFWKTNRFHPGMCMHPALGDTAKQIPIGLHGDGVPIVGKGKIWCKSSWVYSWSSLLSEAPTKDKQFYIGMVWDTLQGPETMDSFFKVIAWSFKFLQQGIWPTEDYQGNKQLAKHC